MSEVNLVFGIARNIYAASCILVTPILRYHLKRRAGAGKEVDARLSEREGLSNLSRPEGKLIWFHCASVGESMAALPVIERLLEHDTDLSVLMTTGTITSARLMAERLPERAFHQFSPLDHPRWVSRFLAHWKPDAAVWVESEFWPNTLLALKGRGIPVMLVNGRISLNSYKRWKRAPALINGILDCFDVCLAQTEFDAKFFSELGARHVNVHGNLKLGAEPLPVNDADLQKFEQSIAGRPCWLMSSTHEGEEIIAADIHKKLTVHFPSLLSIIVPRHPNRGVEIADTLKAMDLSVSRRSVQENLSRDTSIYLADTMGELGLFYRACDIVFMGKSLKEPGGGQNPFEPAKLGCAVLFGPYMGNFVELADAMVSAGAAKEVTDMEALCQEVACLLNDKKILDARKQAVSDFCSQADDIIEDTVARISSIISGR